MFHTHQVFHYFKWVWKERKTYLNESKLHLLVQSGNSLVQLKHSVIYETCLSSLSSYLFGRLFSMLVWVWWFFIKEFHIFLSLALSILAFFQITSDYVIPYFWWLSSWKTIADLESSAFSRPSTFFHSF